METLLFWDWTIDLMIQILKQNHNYNNTFSPVIK
jgi:hypothetical protein